MTTTYTQEQITKALIFYINSRYNNSGLDWREQSLAANLSPSWLKEFDDWELIYEAVSDPSQVIVKMVPPIEKERVSKIHGMADTVNDMFTEFSWDESKALAEEILALVENKTKGSTF